MANIAKTIVATGASSGLGFEMVKQLLAQTQPYRFILGARDTKRTQAAYDELKYDGATHRVTILPVELSNLRTVKSFAQQTLEKVGQDRIDYVMLNAALSKGSEEPGLHGSKWCEAYVVNHLSQHYLMHLLREKLETSRSRIVFVSSGAVRNVSDTSPLENDVKGGSNKDIWTIYSGTKFIQLLGAHWWRRQLQGKCQVVAVSPGMIPGTGLGRHMKEGQGIPTSHPDAKGIPEGEFLASLGPAHVSDGPLTGITGARSMWAAFTREDLPEDPEQIFLTSWGEWWPKDVYGLTLDKDLQNKWSPSKEEIEAEEGIDA